MAMKSRSSAGRTHIRSSIIGRQYRCCFQRGADIRSPQCVAVGHPLPEAPLKSCGIASNTIVPTQFIELIRVSHFAYHTPRNLAVEICVFSSPRVSIHSARRRCVRTEIGLTGSNDDCFLLSKEFTCESLFGEHVVCSHASRRGRGRCSAPIHVGRSRKPRCGMSSIALAASRVPAGPTRLSLTSGSVSGRSPICLLL